MGLPHRKGGRHAALAARQPGNQRGAAESRNAATRAQARKALRQPLSEADVQSLREMAESIGYLVDQWRYAPLGFA